MDEAKSQRTLQERGFDFTFATQIFRDRTVEWKDTRFDYGEPRTVAVGKIGEVFVTLVYTDREQVRRIIAAWPSSRRERKLWQSAE
jgi:uncharacterized protein